MIENTISEDLKRKVDEFAKEKEYVGSKYAGVWCGYDIFIPLLDSTEKAMYVGHPRFIVVKDDEIRMTDINEAHEIINSKYDVYNSRRSDDLDKRASQYGEENNIFDLTYWGLFNGNRVYYNKTNQYVIMDENSNIHIADKSEIDELLSFDNNKKNNVQKEKNVEDRPKNETLDKLKSDIQDAMMKTILRDHELKTTGKLEGTFTKDGFYAALEPTVNLQFSLYAKPNIKLEPTQEIYISWMLWHLNDTNKSKILRCIYLHDIKTDDYLYIGYIVSDEEEYRKYEGKEIKDPPLSDIVIFDEYIKLNPNMEYLKMLPITNNIDKLIDGVSKLELYTPDKVLYYNAFNEMKDIYLKLLENDEYDPSDEEINSIKNYLEVFNYFEKDKIKVYEMQNDSFLIWCYQTINKN